MKFYIKKNWQNHRILIFINDVHYGKEKAYNGLRLANQLNKAHEDVEIRIFLMAELTEWVADSDKVVTF